MSKQKNKKTKKQKNKPILAKKKLIFKLIPVIIVCLGLFFLLLYNFSYRHKIFSGVKIGEINLSGKSVEEVQAAIEDFSRQLNQTGIEFLVTDAANNTKKIIVYPTVISPLDPDLSRNILEFNAQTTSQKAFQIGRLGGFLENNLVRLKLLFNFTSIKADYALNQEELIKTLKNGFDTLMEPTQNAQFYVDESGELKVKEEVLGYVFDYQENIKKLENNLSNLINQPIDLFLRIDYPRVKKNQAITFLPQATEIAKLAPLTLNYGDKTWEVSEAQLKNFLSLDLNGDEIVISLDKNKVEDYLKEASKEINIASQDAKFEMKDNRVIEFQANREGREIDIEASYQAIKQKVLENKENAIELAVIKTQPRVAVGEVNDMGIRELIGRGESDFAGSPKNRVHNIGVGASALNGLLIEPGKEFSLVAALGEIDEKAGYLPELVIRGDRTVPEYGGGLCQIGTTTFRVALNAGLPITERQPHSYRVVYYEPAGLDATIYSPRPDLKFINDTNNYILWQTRIEGTKLIFEFWGTSDGRKTEVSQPKVFNITSPGEPRIIETEDLPPGEEKCVEMAHNGADAEFTRTITYLDKETKTEVWKSHYKAWPKVCLVGKVLEEETETDESATEDADIMIQ